MRQSAGQVRLERIESRADGTLTNCLSSQHAAETRVSMILNQPFFSWNSGVGGRHLNRVLFFIRPPRKGTEALRELAHYVNNAQKLNKHSKFAPA